MAKVEAPLMSLEARGKIGDAMVFFPWKGRHVVRQWLKPTNPKSDLQGYVRAALKALSKWMATVVCTATGGALNSVVYSNMLATAPAGLNWNAYAIQGALQKFQNAGTFDTAAFASCVSDYSALAASIISTFGVQATSLGLVDFAQEYGYTANIPAGLQLYLGGVACYENGIAGADVFAKDPASYAATDVPLLVAAMTTA